MCSVASCIRSSSGFSRSSSAATSSTAAPVRRNRFQLMIFTLSHGCPLAMRLAGLPNLLREQARRAGRGLQLAPDRSRRSWIEAITRPIGTPSPTSANSASCRLASMVSGTVSVTSSV